MNILITGATGNIGISLINEICTTKNEHTIYAGVRNIEKAKILFPNCKLLNYREFDFENPATFAHALSNIDIVFLLRPPHISNINKVFKPLFDEIRNRGIQRVVLLSVQGAESSDIIPHRKIEKLILEYQLDYIFVRPSYFMQNLTTTLLNDIKKYKMIVLPAKNAKFNWIDIGNIAKLCSKYLVDFEKYKNKVYVVTGTENLDFNYVVNKINEISDAGITYKAVSPIRFILFKMKDKLPFGMIIVMCILHFLPRFQKEPEITDTYRNMTGKSPMELDDFIRQNSDSFRNQS